MRPTRSSGAPGGGDGDRLAEDEASRPNGVAPESKIGQSPNHGVDRGNGLSARDVDAQAGVGPERECRVLTSVRTVEADRVGLGNARGLVGSGKRHDHVVAGWDGGIADRDVGGRTVDVGGGWFQPQRFLDERRHKVGVVHDRVELRACQEMPERVGRRPSDVSIPPNRITAAFAARSSSPSIC